LYYSTAIQLEPSNAQTYVWRAMAKRSVGKYRESLADFDSAIYYRPKYELAFSLKGDSYLQLKTYEKAKSDFQTTLSINKANDFALSRWAEIDRLQKRPKEALARFAQANFYNQRNDFAFVRRAAIHLEAGNLDSAIYLATKTIEINALSDWAWQIRGEAYRQKGDLVQAGQDLNMAVAKNPLNLSNKLLLANVLRLQQDYDSAIDLLYAVLEQNPGNVEAQKSLTQVEKLTKYRPLRPKPKSQTFRTGVDIVAKVPPPMESRPKMAPLASGAVLPSSIDYSADICLPRMQGGQGACVGFAMSYLASYHEKKETGNAEVFAPAFIYHLANNGLDKGAIITEAFEVWRSKGICHEYSMLYNEYDHKSTPTEQAQSEARKYRIQGSFPLWNLEELKYQLSIGNPLLISVIADQSLWDLRAEPWTKRYGKVNGAHAMLVIGYDDERSAVKVINSWGRSWGENGYGWISYSLFDEVRLQLFVTKDAVNVEMQEVPEDIKILETQDPSYQTIHFPQFNFGTPWVSITSGFRNTFTGTLDIFGTSNVPPLSGYNAQIVVYYYDAFGNKIASQLYPYTTYDGQASHGTSFVSIPFLGLLNQSWWVKTPSIVFPYWHINGDVIIAQPILFIDGFQAAIGPQIRL
jgi:tetratricopeptide (TPR) repeat protein